MLRFLRFALCFVFVLAPAAGAQTEICATYKHHTLEVAVPTQDLRGRSARLTVELLDPEDRILAHAERTVDSTPEAAAWKIALTPGPTIAFDDLVWQRVRARLAYPGERAAAFEQVRSVSAILRRPVVHLLGQTSYLDGSTAALRVLVNDGTPNAVPVDGGSVRIEVLHKDAAAQTLFSGKLDHRGTSDAQFRFPATLTGSIALRITAETVLGSAETTQTIHLQNKVSILLTTEKPLYQPSQVIHVRALALDRANHHAAASEPITFELEDGRGNKVFRKQTQTDGFGVASAEIPLADEVNLGAWHLTARMPAGSEEADANQAGLTLQVERYVLPKFRVSLDFTKKDGKPQRDFRPGDHVTGTLVAKYFFGKPVGDSAITLKVIGMDFGVFDAASVEGHTDAAGNYQFDLQLPTYFAARSGSQGTAPVLIEATVRDTAGHAETRSEPITVTDSALLIQAVAEGGKLVPGLDNAVYLMTSYPDGTPARATVRLHTRGTNAPTVETGGDGIGVLHLQGNAANQQLRLEADDHHGKRAESTVHLDLRNGEDQVLLRSDRAVYHAGDAIQFDVFSTRSSGSVYIDLIQDGQTILTRDVDLNAGRASLIVPATAALAGTVDVHAYLFGANSAVVRDHRVLFVQPADELHIEDHADAASYLPGSEAHVHFHVTDAHGKGVEAALGLEVVDEAVFALAEKQPGFAKVFFYLEQELMKPRFEIHSLAPNEIVAPTSVQGAAQEDAARVLFAAAESLDPHTLDTTFGDRLPDTSRDAFAARYLDAFTDQAAEVARQLHAATPNPTRHSLQAAFAALRSADGLALHDAWNTPLRLEPYSSGDRPRIVRLLSDGPDRQPGTADDLAVMIDVAEGTLYVRSDTIALRIEHDHGPVNGFAEITGTVLDQSGAIIPGAHITVQSLAGKGLRHGDADQAGNFTFAGLPAGRYHVTITRLGFMAATRSLDLLPRDQALLTSTLQVGFETQTVEVNAAAGMPMAMDAVIINALPLESRGVFAMRAVDAPVSTLKARAQTTQTEAHTRSYFPEALFIAPEIITDSHGTASVTIPMADSITTWRMAMFASTRSGALGTAAASLKVFQDFFVDLDLPVTITQGDRISLPVAIYNYAGKRGAVQLHLEQADWFEMPGFGAEKSGAEKTVNVESGSVGSAQFTLQAQHAGTFKLTLIAHMGDRQDTVVREIEVVPNGEPRETVVNGRLEAGAQSSTDQTIALPANALPEASKLFVRLYPGPLSQLIEGMDGVLRMPYGCFEQTSSSTYPNVLALDYMKRTGKLTPEVHAKAEGFIATGYQRLLTFEVPGGGFSWFGRAPANKILTAYGLMEFHDMSAVAEVDPHVLERTRDWLIQQQQPDGSWKPDTSFINEGATNRFNKDLVRITAYIAWSLASSGYTGPALDKARSFLQQQLAGTSTQPDAYTLAILANFAVDSHADAAWTHALFERLMNAAQHGDDQLWWTSEETGMYATGSSAAVETTGLVVQAMLKSGEENEAARKALAWLLSKKSGAGNWGSTQATIMALRALVMASEKSGADALGTVEVLLDGQPFTTLELTRGNNDLLHQFVLPAGSANRIALRYRGTGGLAWQIAGRYFVPWSDRETKDALSIDVAYDRTKLKETDSVAATATIHSNLGAAANMIMVDLGIPPGFDLETEDLQTLIEKTAHQRTARLEKFSLTATQAILYFNSIGAGETVKVHFHLRAKYPIRARTFESKVYEYYDPAVAASAVPVVMEVVPK